MCAADAGAPLLTLWLHGTAEAAEPEACSVHSTIVQVRIISRTIEVTHVITQHCTTSRNMAMRNSKLATQVSANRAISHRPVAITGSVDVGSHAQVAFM